MSLTFEINILQVFYVTKNTVFVVLGYKKNLSDVTKQTIKKNFIFTFLPKDVLFICFEQQMQPFNLLCFFSSKQSFK